VFARRVHHRESGRARTPRTGAVPGTIDPRMVANLSTQCTTAVGGFAGMGPGHATSLGIETTLEPDVHYWVLVAIPDDDVIR
jgi:hypothetical protein